MKKFLFKFINIFNLEPDLATNGLIQKDVHIHK